MEQSSLAYLARQASFVGSSSPSQSNWRAKHHYPTSFIPSLILNCLANTEDAVPIRESISQMLVRQRSANWSFNYWLRGSHESKTFPYPDDLDDTFCALIGLYRHDPTTIDEAALARIVHLLLATETTAGGPYRTWLVRPDSPQVWQDVDLAVNANIAYFLQLIGSPSQPLLQYLETKIMNNDYSSAYYPTAFPIWYYLARVCPAASRKKLAHSIQAVPPENALQLALSICALRQLGEPVEDRLKQLAKQQATDGSWPAAAFCLDPTRDENTYYHGSAALTTAFAIEALTPLAKLAKPPPQPTPKIQTTIVAQAHRDISRLAPELREQAKLALDSTLNSDPNHQITLLPHRFAQSLKHPPKAGMHFYSNLGLANLYGWIAYTIYDDFLDDEGRPALLPVANFALRSSVEYFRKALPNQAGFQRLVGQTFTTIDAANAWELAHCRSVASLPNYGRRTKLAERSLGHSLTPIAVLLQAGHQLNSPEVRAVQKAFRHYLIARQLDDDAHDWQADLEHEHISYVVAEILRKTDATNLQRQFWYRTLPKVCRVIKEHIDSARNELNKVNILQADNAMFQLLDGLETSLQATLDKQSQASTFLTSYSQIIKK